MLSKQAAFPYSFFVRGATTPEFVPVVLTTWEYGWKHRP